MHGQQTIAATAPIAPPPAPQRDPREHIEREVLDLLYAVVENQEAMSQRIEALERGVGKEAPKEVARES